MMYVCVYGMYGMDEMMNVCVWSVVMLRAEHGRLQLQVSAPASTGHWLVQVWLGSVLLLLAGRAEGRRQLQVSAPASTGHWLVQVQRAAAAGWQG